MFVIYGHTDDSSCGSVCCTYTERHFTSHMFFPVVSVCSGVEPRPPALWLQPVMVLCEVCGQEWLGATASGLFSLIMPHLACLLGVEHLFFFFSSPGVCPEGCLVDRCSASSFSSVSISRSLPEHTETARWSQVDGMEPKNTKTEKKKIIIIITL